MTDLVARAAALAEGPARVLLGIVGPPGAGKSTLARELVAAVGGTAALVPMDGFHLADAELRRLGLSDRKGAPETFDAAGYVALLRRLRADSGEAVYAPEFRRELELAEAGALRVGPEARLVVTEGNYLLLDGPFAAVRDLLDQCWYVEVDPVLRRGRLRARHLRHGRSADQADAWIAATDEPNALLVEATRGRAHLLVDERGQPVR